MYSINWLIGLSGVRHDLHLRGHFYSVWDNNNQVNVGDYHVLLIWPLSARRTMALTHINSAYATWPDITQANLSNMTFLDSWNDMQLILFPNSVQASTFDESVIS